jgi:GNAT superfamily N-acetyltransferase
MIEIRKATDADKPTIGKIMKAVVATGDTYTLDPNSTEEELVQTWFSPNMHTYVALLDGEIVGTFFLRANQAALGAHVGNAGYMVKPDVYSKGIGRHMGEWSLNECRRLGFHSLQFNFVVKTNERAVKLWESIGMQIIGEIPEAFNHKELGLVNAYIMYQKL